MGDMRVILVRIQLCYFSAIYPFEKKQTARLLALIFSQTNCNTSTYAIALNNFENPLLDLRTSLWYLATDTAYLDPDYIARLHFRVLFHHYFQSFGGKNKVPKWFARFLILKILLPTLRVPFRIIAHTGKPPLHFHDLRHSLCTTILFLIRTNPTVVTYRVHSLHLSTLLAANISFWKITCRTKRAYFSRLNRVFYSAKKQELLLNDSSIPQHRITQPASVASPYFDRFVYFLDGRDFGTIRQERLWTFINMKMKIEFMKIKLHIFF